MVLLNILKRKDAASVVIAVVVAFIISNFLSTITGPLTNKLVSSHDFGGAGWKELYLTPFVALILELVVLEVLCRIYILAASSYSKK